MIKKTTAVSGKGTLSVKALLGSFLQECSFIDDQICKAKSNARAIGGITQQLSEAEGQARIDHIEDIRNLSESAVDMLVKTSNDIQALIDLAENIKDSPGIN